MGIPVTDALLEPEQLARRRHQVRYDAKLAVDTVDLVVEEIRRVIDANSNELAAGSAQPAPVHPEGKPSRRAAGATRKIQAVER